MNYLINYNSLKVLLNIINNDKNKRVIIESLKVLLICLNNWVSIVCDSIDDIFLEFLYINIKIYKLSSCFCEIIFTHPNQNFAYKLINYELEKF